LERLEEARPEFEEACRLGPNNYVSWMWLAALYEKLERWDDMAGALVRMKELRPEAREWRDMIMRNRERFVGDAGGAKPQAAGDAETPAPPVTPGQKTPPGQE